MSSAVVSTSAALGRPFVFDEHADREGRCHPERSGECAKRISRGVEGSLSLADSRLSHVIPASQLDIRPAPEMVSSGIPAIDTLTGGLPRGCLTEICGPASSGRTALLLAALSAATQRGEYCAVVDASDTLDPQSAAAAGVELDRMLWVRCGEYSPRMRGDSGKQVHQRSEDRMKSRSTDQTEQRMEQVLRATDLLLESGGFGLIVLDLGDLPQQAARRIPLTTWFRFRRAVENKPTILLAIEQYPIAGSCSSLLLQLGSADELAAERRKNAAHGASRGVAVDEDEAPEGRKKISLPAQPELDFPCPPHTQLFTGLNITAELIRSRLDRKPARAVMFETKTAWAG
jgi:hypothetical protein